MNHQLSENKLRKLRILIAPLDWGLGHATRCIPIIKELLRQDCDVYIASEGAQELLLKKEFPELPFLQLRGYKVHYSRKPWAMPLQIFLQSSKILKAIKSENRWLKSMMAEYNFDAVISDNRYGMHHPKTFSVFITHQLCIKSFSGKWLEKFLQKRNYRYINKFDECWIPDNEIKNNLAGELSHPEKKPTGSLKYIGWLSRMKEVKDVPEKGGLLIMLSGPEPQRSIFEDIIIEEISHFNGSATVVRGVPTAVSMIPSTNTIHFYNHLTAEELNKEMEKADFIVSRSGYSTIMEVVSLKKKSILVPTPGQTEQEYLAKYLLQNQIAYCCDQKHFSLQNALKKANDFSYCLPDIVENKLENIIEDLIAVLSKNKGQPIKKI